MARIFILTIMMITGVVHATAVKVVTSEFPPFQTYANEKINGLATEVVKSVLANAGISSDFQVYPWPRAYKIATNEQNVLIYSISRIPEREKLFKWIGVIAPYEVYFWKLSSRTDIKVETMEDAKKYLVGGVNSDIKAMYLEKIGFINGKNLSLVNSDELNLRMLQAKRIDIIPSEVGSFKHRVKAANLDLQSFTKLTKISGLPNELYLAASLNTSDEVIEKIRFSLAEFSKTKQYKTLQKKFKD